MSSNISFSARNVVAALPPSEVPTAVKALQTGIYLDVVLATVLIYDAGEFACCGAARLLTASTSVCTLDKEVRVARIRLSMFVFMFFSCRSSTSGRVLVVAARSGSHLILLTDFYFWTIEVRLPASKQAPALPKAIPI